MLHRFSSLRRKVILPSMTTQSGMLRRSANHSAKYSTLCSDLLFFLFRNAIGKKGVQLAIDQPVSRGSKGALGPITR